MLTEGNKKYLETISDTERVVIHEFDPRTQDIAKSITKEIEAILPSVRVLYFGSSALGIAGENDVDLGVIDAGEYQRSGDTLREKYGAPVKTDEKNHVIRWEFQRNGFVIEMFLSDVLEGRRLEHIKNHALIENDANLRRQYEQLKRSCVGLTKREYMRKKLEFFNSLAIRDGSSNIVH